MQAYTSPRKTFGFFVQKRLIIGILGVAVAAAILLVDFIYNRHDVRIYADGREISIVMRDGTVADSLTKAKIDLGEHDEVEPSMPTAVNGDLKINITRMMPVSVIADGQTNLSWVPVGSNVEQILNRAKITIASGDQVKPDLNQILSSGGDIEVTRVVEEVVQESVNVPYQTVKRDDTRLEKGLVRIVQKGKDGLIQRTIKVTHKNGKVVNREVVGENTVRKPMDKIVAVGTMAVKTVSRGDSIRYSRVLEVSATAYSHTGNNMSSGIYPYKGAIAVDPAVIPMGTQIYVDGYGYAKALDTGGAIRGNKIDLFFDTRSEALRWGRRTVKVYLLEN